jgi:signal peptide peptidase SppA
MRKAFIADLVFNQPLMIEAGKLNVILSVLASNHMGEMDLTALPSPVAAAKQANSAPSGAQIVNGVGILSITGSLVHRASYLDASSGVQSYQQLSNSFNELVQDSSVKEIVLDMNSFGGSVNGVFDFADEIFAARAAKKITAIIDENAYSAAYLIASSANEIIVPRTAGVGSIGVIAAHVDRSKMNEGMGIKVTPIFAGARKNDFSPNEPLSDAARNIVQDEVNRNYNLFVETVARNLFTGAAGVTAGLADRVQNARDALNQIITANNAPIVTGGNLSTGRLQRAATAMKILSN